MKPEERKIILDQLNKVDSIDQLSDGYHTFDQYMTHRMLYNAAFFNQLAAEGEHMVTKSHCHSDGEACFGGGWFIVTANLPTGQISNHYEYKWWDLFKVQEVMFAPEWDGHTPEEACKRLMEYILNNQKGIKMRPKNEPKVNLKTNSKKRFMKKFIGTKVVEAMAMTLGEFIQHSGRNPYANSEDMHGGNEPGYLVKYKDGYESWSPKDVFDDAYKCSETFIDRLKIEYEELGERLGKLNTALNSEGFKEKVGEEQYNLMCEQDHGMTLYWNALRDRINNLQAIK